MRGQLAGLAFGIGLASGLGACVVPVSVQRTGPGAGLPDYAKPRMEVVDRELGELLRYRTLSRADFRASAPRPDVAKHAEEMGAYTCALLPPKVTREIEVAHDDVAGVYVARVAEAEYFAVMDPDCSWWNPSGSRIPEPYVLQHEQIHFALVEIEARKVAAKVRGMEARASSRAEATLDLQQEIDRAIRVALAAVLEINTRFDHDTSATYAPGKQAEWLARAEAELRRLPANDGSGVDRQDPEPRSDPALEPL